MIREMKLKFGRAPGLGPESIQTTPVTVFVGPNNSGKSKVLTEIAQYCSSGNKNAGDVILDSVEFENRSAEEAALHLRSVLLKPHGAETLIPGNVIVGKRSNRLHVPEAQLVSVLQNPQSRVQQFCVWYLSYNTLILDGRNRINLVNDQPAGDLNAPAQSSFQVLFRDDAKRAEVRRIIHEAFGQYFVIDPTHLGQFRIRLSSQPPAQAIVERGIHEEAVRFHAAALHIGQASDGVKAFTGIITEVLAGDPKVLLIDEPEAFLHPSLAYLLGKEMAHVRGCSKRGGVARLAA